MYDPRFDTLAHVITNHSTKIQPGEFVLIESIDTPQEMVIALIRSVRKAGGIPIVELKQNRILREIILGDADGIKLISQYEAYRMERVDAYVGIRGSFNITEMEDIPEAMQRYQRDWVTPVHLKIRVPHKKWVILRFPLPAMAQQAQKSTEAFEDYYFDVCTMDYSRMARAMEPLKSLMEATDEVHIIVGEDTDLRFSIKDIPVVPCAGECNIPDGEIFTAPVRDSVTGTIHFNTPTIYQGTTFTDIRLGFKAGKIVEATANNSERLNEILDTDEGARYIGEFSLAFNPYITDPMLDTLFDEKIAGSFHFTPGQAYKEAYNGNESAVHWDLVMRQMKKHGGGEIYFDGNLVRKDGLFVRPDLEALNPENLK